MKRVIVGSVALVAALIAMFVTGAAGARTDADAKPTTKGVSDVYIVLLEEAPVAAYDGRHRRLPGHEAGAGRKLDKNAPNVAALRGLPALAPRRGRERRRRGAALRLRVLVQRLRRAAQPRRRSRRCGGTRASCRSSATRSRSSPPTTRRRFLGLNAGGGIWSQLGGQAKAGEDVIIGVVDTGIWPEHPSFSGAGYGPPPAGWSGECQSGEQWSQQHCNNKLIGARYYEKGYGHFFGGLARRLPVGARPRRPWHAHRLDRRRQRRRRGVDLRPEPRHDQRHGAARPHRRLQGVLARRLRDDRPRSPRSTRPSRTAST